MTRILRGLGSQRLPCGCLLGIYETYDGRVVSILDAQGRECEDNGHLPGSQTEVSPPAADRQASA